MKILATEENERYETVYVCEVTHTEIEKFLNKYYNNVKALRRGDSVDLGKGYDFLVDVKKSLEKTQELISSNEKVISTILTGITLLGAKSVDAELPNDQ